MSTKAEGRACEGDGEGGPEGTVLLCTKPVPLQEAV